ncbi:uncharacterized protein JCM6883_007278 [Sporobolomyces salmoneus]|uniref:uncharacterized protein n=1 Tax=Sporobolomyces salmoneus TaxID=183962 RepID=UPI0031700207
MNHWTIQLPSFSINKRRHEHIEQRDQVEQLVKLARDSLQTHRLAVSVLQAILLLVILVKSTPSRFAKFLSLFLLSLSILRSLLYIPIPPHFPPVPFNLGLSVPVLLYSVYLHSIGIEWEESSFAGLAPLAVLLLRVGTELEGERAIEEAKGLEKYMYQSPEA